MKLSILPNQFDMTYEKQSSNYLKDFSLSFWHYIYLELNNMLIWLYVPCMFHILFIQKARINNHNKITIYGTSIYMEHSMTIIDSLKLAFYTV